MTIKNLPHKVWASRVLAERFAAWVDEELGLPSGSGRTLTETQARVEEHPSMPRYGYPITATVAAVLTVERGRSRTAGELAARPVLADARAVDEEHQVRAEWDRGASATSGGAGFSAERRSVR